MAVPPDRFRADGTMLPWSTQQVRAPLIFFHSVGWQERVPVCPRGCAHLSFTGREFARTKKSQLLVERTRAVVVFGDPNVK
jgi:hypothetical protein